MSLPRPRSDRLGSADETLHQVAAGSLDIWTPMSTVANGVTLTTQPPYFNGPASVASSSLRSESPMSPIQKQTGFDQTEANISTADTSALSLNLASKVSLLFGFY